MAEVAVTIVLKKLAEVIVKEAHVLGRVGKKIERVQRELTRIQCCMRDAYSKCKGDERVRNWLNELRDVAYRIEDTSDTFFLKVGYKDASILQKLKKLCNKPLDVYFLHKLGTELDNIQNELEEISKSRVDYGIRDLEDKCKEEMVNMRLRRATYQQVDETEVVGMQDDKKNILKLLHPDEIRRRAVITIVGPGGLGKTTLAHMVYISAREDFEYHIMLSISQQFSLADLLRRMISIRENQDVGDLIIELKRFLSSRRYLIILDDVWEADLWNQLKDVLPDVKNGSRILITTRSIDVAKAADAKIEPYQLNFLDDRKSLDLLLKKALPYQEPGEECPSDLLDLADTLSKKCKGLPLALIVLGGILSTKEQSYSAWERVLQTMNWHLDGGDCIRILAMSYDDMPHYLKPCFQYLASFPEDHMISAKRLIQMWIAEGFIPFNGRPTIEIMAEDCLEELFKRSMIQVSSRSSNGSIKYFQVHDLLRDLAIHEAEQENFVTIFSQTSTSDVKKLNRRIRCASIQGRENYTQLMEYLGANTRSLLLFTFDIGHNVSLQCSNFRLLKVLELVGVSNSHEYVLNSSHELIHLKYLGIRDSSIKISSLSFHRMKNLETLLVDSNRSSNCNFDSLWRIGTLRHVRFSNRGLIGPISTSIVRNLQTLQWVMPHRTWARKLPLLNNLRKLAICEVEDWVTMTNLLKTLHSLVSLKISSIMAHNIPVEIVYPKELPNYENLRSLILSGIWSCNVTLQASLFPPHLVKLTLIESKLRQNPMPELGKLKSLKKLCLLGVFGVTYVGPIICSEGFPALQHLELVELTSSRLMKELTVAQGVMPKLIYLKVANNTELHIPPELQHVTAGVNFDLF